MSSSNGSDPLTPLLEKYGPIASALLEDPKMKNLIESGFYVTLSLALAPRRLRKGIEILQKIRQGEAISYREGYRLIAAVSALAQTVASAAMEIQRRTTPLYEFQDSKVASPRV